MEDIILCTKNQGKVREFQELFSLFNLDINLISLDSLGDNDEVEENGSTFKANAFLKASYYYNKYHMATISDDSGLCIEYLDGAPGINSARYSGMGPKENIKKVLKELENVSNRKAYFVCYLCYIDKNGVSNYFEGRVSGSIALSESGKGGFGYDPIFLVEYNGKMRSMASLGESIKNKISHRYHAILNFSEWYKAK